MSLITVACLTVYCDVCDNTLDDPEFEVPIHFDTQTQMLDAAKREQWTVTEQAVSFGPRIVTGFAVCEQDDRQHADARALAAGSRT